jgi:hypothetical protein
MDPDAKKYTRPLQCILYDRPSTACRAKEAARSSKKRWKSAANGGGPGK